MNIKNKDHYILNIKTLVTLTTKNFFTNPLPLPFCILHDEFLCSLELELVNKSLVVTLLINFTEPKLKEEILRKEGRNKMSE